MNQVSNEVGSRNSVEFTVYALPRSTCNALNRMRVTLELDPIYQRQGNIWSLENKQLFIDSLLNGIDIPKIYLHDGNGVASGKKYAIIDGKQRLEAIFEFYDNDFPLADGFEIFNTSDLKSLNLSDSEVLGLGGKYYKDLDREFPQVARLLDGCVLSVMVVETDDLEAIEEMFSRLNDAVPLNAAEKRQAIGDPMRRIVRNLASHAFFTGKLPFSNKRYRHFDVAAKFVKWALAVLEQGSWDGMKSTSLDVKRIQLDRMFAQAKESQQDSKSQDAEDLVLKTLDALESRYEDSDQALSSIGTLSVLFLDQLRATHMPAIWDAMDRAMVLEFERFRRERENLEPTDSEKVMGSLTVAEYNRLTQSPNDGGALLKRLEILHVYSDAMKSGKDPLLELSRARLID